MMFDINRLEELVSLVSVSNGARGMALGVVDRGGNVLLERCYGYRDLDGRLPVDRDTVFGLASVTKSFTALAIMQLEAQGKLRLTDSVSDHVPQFTGKHSPAPVCISHLLTHSAGFFPQHRTTVAEATEGTDFADSLDDELAYSTAFAERGVELVARRLDSESEFTGLPGERYSYCNDGYGLLSDIIRTHGPYSSYGEYVESEICAPPGMTRTNMALSFFASRTKKKAT